MKKLSIASSALLFALPFIASAQQLTAFRTLLASIGGLINAVVPILMAAALAAFFWGLVKYIWSGGKDSAKGKNIMIAGLVSLFVMASVWGIINLAQQSLNINNGTVNVPSVPANSGY